MTPGRYEYCAIYVRGPADREAITDLLVGIIDGQRGRHTIYGDGLDIDVRTNPDHDPNSGDFAHWPIKLEIDFHSATPASRIVDTTALILTCLWHRGGDAVASCEYENHLPDNGGYPRHRP